MKKGKIAKFLLALGIGAATVFSGAALATGCFFEKGSEGDTTIEDTTKPGDDTTKPGDDTTKPGDDITKPGDDDDDNKGGENTPGGDDDDDDNKEGGNTPGGDDDDDDKGGGNTPGGDDDDDDNKGGGNTPGGDDDDPTSEPVIGLIKATLEGFDDLLAGGVVELKANTPVKVNVADGITGEYPVFITPPICAKYEGVGEMPYPDLVITATVDGVEYILDWINNWGMDEVIDFTSVTSITVEANQDVSVIMTLIDFDFIGYYVDVNLFVNGVSLEMAIGREIVAEGTVIDEGWILKFVYDLSVNCELIGAYLDCDMTKPLPSDYALSDDAEGVIVGEYEGETIRYLALWVDLHNFLKAEYQYYEGNDLNRGNGRVYNVEDEDETVEVDTDGIVTYLDTVDISTIDGWTVSYVLLDYYFNDLDAGSAPWTLGVGYYIVRVDASKQGEKTLSTYLFYHVEVEDPQEPPPVEGGRVEVQVQPRFYVSSVDETVQITVDAVSVYFNGKYISHDAEWDITYMLYALKDGKVIELPDGIWELGVGDYCVIVRAHNNVYGDFKEEAYFTVEVKGGHNDEEPFLVQGLSPVYYVSYDYDTVTVYTSVIEVFLNHVMISDNAEWAIEYTLYSINDDCRIGLDGNAWVVGVGAYRLYVTAQNDTTNEHYETNVIFRVEVAGTSHEDPVQYIGLITQYNLDSADETVTIDLRHVSVLINNVDITGEADWTIEYELYSLRNGQQLNLVDNVCVVGAGEYRLTISVRNENIGEYYNREVIIHVDVTGGYFEEPIKVPNMSHGFQVYEEGETVEINIGELRVLVNDVDVTDDEDWKLDYKLYIGNSDDTVAVENNCWKLGAGDYWLHVTAQNEGSGEYYESTLPVHVELILTEGFSVENLVCIMGYNKIVSVDSFGYLSIEQILLDTQAEISYKKGVGFTSTLRALNKSGDLQFTHNLQPVPGIYRITARFNGTFVFAFNILVNDGSQQHSVYAIVPENGWSFYKGMNVSDVYNAVCVVYYGDGFVEYTTLNELGVSNGEIEALDLNTAGEKTLHVTYGDYSGILTFNIFDSTIVAIDFDQDNIPDYFVGIQADNLLYVLSCRVYHSDMHVVDMYLIDMGITEEIFAGVDLTTTGIKTVEVAYEGFRCTVTFELTEQVVEVWYDLNGTDITSTLALKGTPIERIIIYSNDVTEVFLRGVSEPVITKSGMGENFITVDGHYDGDHLNITLRCDWGNSIFSNLTKSDVEQVFGLRETGVYTGEVKGKQVELSLYYVDEGGYGFYTKDGVTYDVTFAERDNIIHIFGVGYFLLADDNTFTVVEN